MNAIEKMSRKFACLHLRWAITYNIKSETAASAPAEKKPDPVEILHGKLLLDALGAVYILIVFCLDMTLDTGKPLEVVSKTRLQVAPGVWVWSETPFFVEVEKPTFVRGTEVLDERFARAWSDLPVELQVSDCLYILTVFIY